jgi:hypothetical protein
MHLISAWYLVKDAAAKYRQTNGRKARAYRLQRAEFPEKGEGQGQTEELMLTGFSCQPWDKVGVVQGHSGAKILRQSIKLLISIICLYGKSWELILLKDSIRCHLRHLRLGLFILQALCEVVGQPAGLFFPRK